MAGTFCGEASVGEAHDGQAAWLQHAMHLCKDLRGSTDTGLTFLPGCDPSNNSAHTCKAVLRKTMQACATSAGLKHAD